MVPLGLLCLFFLHQTGAVLDLFTHSARIGSNTKIPCKFNIGDVPSAQRRFSISWHFQENEIFKYPNRVTAPIPRLSVDEDRINDGVADLFMSGVSISDGGLYKCLLIHTTGKREEKEIRLDVHAPPKITITDKNVVITKESVLSCAVSEYYPVDIDIKWLRDGIILSNVTVEKPQKDLDGTYSVRSSVTIIPTKEDRERIFSCRVQHESLTAPHREDFQLVYGDTESSFPLIGVIIGVSVGVLALIFIAAAVAIYRCRKKAQNNPTEADNLEGQNENLMPSNGGNPRGVNAAEIPAAGGRRDVPGSAGYAMATLPGPPNTEAPKDQEGGKAAQWNSECSGVNVAAKRRMFEKETMKVGGSGNRKS